MEMIKIFENNQFGDVMVIIQNGKYYFEATKIAKILNYTNPNAAVNRHCVDKGVTFHEVGVVTGKRYNGEPIIQNHMKKFIDEGNLYRLILKSKLPSAVEFEKWIFDTVIPSIRQHGAYISEEVLEESLKDPKVIECLIDKLSNQNKEIEILKNQILENQDYTNLGKTVKTADSVISIGEFAKLLNGIGINIGRNRLFHFLREEGYLMKEHGQNQPKQIYLDKGIFKIKQLAINTSEGPKIRITTYITGKGQKYLINKIIEGELFYAGII